MMGSYTTSSYLWNTCYHIRCFYLAKKTKKLEEKEDFFNQNCVSVCYVSCVNLFFFLSWHSAFPLLSYFFFFALFFLAAISHYYYMCTIINYLLFSRYFGLSAKKWILTLFQFVPFLFSSFSVSLFDNDILFSMKEYGSILAIGN